MLPTVCDVGMRSQPSPNPQTEGGVTERGEEGIRGRTRQQMSPQTPFSAARTFFHCICLDNVCSWHCPGPGDKSGLCPPGACSREERWSPALRQWAGCCAMEYRGHQGSFSVCLSVCNPGRRRNSISSLGPLGPPQVASVLLLFILVSLRVCLRHSLDSEP